jgi:hypothetical protein
VDDAVALNRIIADLTKLGDNCGFILCINDRLDDFKTPAETSVFKVTMGKRRAANYYVENPKELASILSSLL